MFRSRRMYIGGIVFCAVTLVYALLPVFIPQLLPSLGIPLQDGGLSLYEAGALTAFGFIVSGIIICLTAGDINTVSDFICFLYAAAFCIIGKCRGYDARSTLPVILIILSDVASAFTVFFGIRILNRFFKMMKPRKGNVWLQRAEYLSFLIVSVKYVLIVTGITGFWTLSIELAGNILLWGFFVCVTVFLSFFLKKIPRQSSLAMRTILYGVCIAFFPFLCQVLIDISRKGLQSFLLYWDPVSVLSLLAIPSGFICAALQMARNSSDSISPKIMAGFSTLGIVTAAVMLHPDLLNHMFILLGSSTIAYEILHVFLDRFLNPKLTAVELSLNSLERTAFRCNEAENILVVVADWLMSILNPEFVAFYELSDRESEPGKFVYCDLGPRINDRDILSFMLNDRLENRQMDEKRMIHRKVGFSVPMYQKHELSGFIFIGTKSEGEMFSEREMSLLTPVSRILMESMMVLSLKKQADYVSEMQNQIVFSFADMIESRDGTTGQHIKRTSTIVSLLAKNLREHNIYADKLMPSDYEMIALAAPLHDIGKIKVPDSILSKPGKLTDEEFATIKTHPEEGEKIIKRTMAHIEDERYLKLAREMALYHHEKWNGKGYPKGLSGDDIPVSARIMAIADVFDALCSKRSYKEAFTVTQAFNTLEESRGSHFEPCLVDAMKMLRPELEKIYSGAR